MRIAEFKPITKRKVLISFSSIGKSPNFISGGEEYIARYLTYRIKDNFKFLGKY